MAKLELEGGPIVVNLEADEEGDLLQLLKKHLETPGGLIGLPTETVYGLAANGLCEVSVRRIFEVKGRPLTDPVILHVPNFIEAFKAIYSVDAFEAFVIFALARRFSPGPLTIVARRRPNLPDIVSAGGECVAVRHPNHPAAQEILESVKFPLAAPSANKFGHISPTSAQHVSLEFPQVPMYIVDGGNCVIGIESTVVKIEPVFNGEPNVEEILKHHNSDYLKLEEILAAIDIEKLPPSAECLDAFLTKTFANLGKSADVKFALGFLNHVYKQTRVKRCIAILRRGGVKQTDIRGVFSNPIFKNLHIEHRDVFASAREVSESPGMLLTHYAPNAPTFLLSRERQMPSDNPISLDKVVVIDVGNTFERHSRYFLKYIQLDEDETILARNMYETLRMAESAVLKFTGRVFADVSEHGRRPCPYPAVIAIYYAKKSSEMGNAIGDKLHRSASGKKIYANFMDGGLVLSF